MTPLSHWLRLPSELFFRREDERIYAVVRVVFAAVALLNLIYLWPDRAAFFSDAGFVDHAAAMQDARPFYLSIFAFARSEAAVTAVMLITGAALLMLLAGIRARLAVLWVLVWHISYMARSPLPLAGWDLVLRCYAFLLLVSPLGECWSLPALLRSGAARLPAMVSGHGLVLMRLQVVVIYWQAVLARFLHPDPYWKSGEFLSYFLLSHHARWPGLWVLEYGALLSLATFAIQIGEAVIPPLLWIKRTRWWGAAMGAALHIGISIVTRDIGLFCLAMLMSYTSFLRQEDVETLQRWMSRGGKSETTA